MLPTYDAKSIAEVMGLAFARGPGTDSPPTATPKAGKARSPAIPAPPAPDFVIRVDDTPLHIVAVVTQQLQAIADTPRTTATARRRSQDQAAPAPSPLLIEKAVESGLPRAALRHVAERIAGSDPARIAALEWGVVPKTTLERRGTRLSPQESERTERLARLFVHARRALGTEAEAREFMIEAHPELGGRSPIEAARTDLGTRRAEQILNALEYGLAL